MTSEEAWKAYCKKFRIEESNGSERVPFDAGIAYERERVLGVIGREAYDAEMNSVWNLHEGRLNEEDLPSYEDWVLSRLPTLCKELEQPKQEEGK